MTMMMYPKIRRHVFWQISNYVSEIPLLPSSGVKKSLSAFQVSVFTGLEVILSGDKEQNFIGRSCVTYLAVAL
jgi:hypothetical protein